jgi:hypothetical protein
MSATLDQKTRNSIWHAVRSILNHGPVSLKRDGATGLALGYVQSGKTTSITALIASAADEGYRIIIAILGITNLLLSQNRERIEDALGISKRNDFKWVVEINPSGRKKAVQISDWLEKNRVVLIPVLKHAGRIDQLAEVLSTCKLSNVPVLIIDDEADQASLNNEVHDDLLSRTYEAITNLRHAVPSNLYIQYTATPYAPLLIEKSDHLLPQFIEFLQPGPGYTGGREFFIDYADQVVRVIPALEEQNKQAPIGLPDTLVDALAVFISGAALLLTHDPSGSPVSMLVHSTHRNDIQERYHFLIDRQLRQWRAQLKTVATIADLPMALLKERARLVGLGAREISDDAFLTATKMVVNEAVLWLLNSKEAINRVDWRVAPIHILVGGNKLDRGFTVEGLTVTYMNRKHSNQVDTLEQRARAFGYRRDQLPYCQFFASKRTLKILRDIVFTEYDLRARLQDHIESGGPISAWADEVGLLLPEGTRPTRQTVIRALSTSTAGWKTLRKPIVSTEVLTGNRAAIAATGVFTADYIDYGRLKHRTTWVEIERIRSLLVSTWQAPDNCPGWNREELQEFFERYPDQRFMVPVLLMEEPTGAPRVRKWDSVTGFVNLFQGRDQNGGLYPGDRAVPNIESCPDQIAVQIHRVTRRDDPEQIEILTLAVYVGERVLVRKHN